MPEPKTKTDEQGNEVQQDKHQPKPAGARLEQDPLGVGLGLLYNLMRTAILVPHLIGWGSSASEMPEQSA